MARLRISLTLPGAVSLGAYEGGALAALLLACQERRAGRGDSYRGLCIGGLDHRAAVGPGPAARSRPDPDADQGMGRACLAEGHEDAFDAVAAVWRGSGRGRRWRSWV